VLIFKFQNLFYLLFQVIFASVMTYISIHFLSLTVKKEYSYYHQSVLYLFSPILWISILFLLSNQFDDSLIFGGINLFYIALILGIFGVLASIFFLVTILWLYGERMSQRFVIYSVNTFAFAFISSPPISFFVFHPIDRAPFLLSPIIIGFSLVSIYFFRIKSEFRMKEITYLIGVLALVLIESFIVYSIIIRVIAFKS